MRWRQKIRRMIPFKNRSTLYLSGRIFCGQRVTRMVRLLWNFSNTCLICVWQGHMKINRLTEHRLQPRHFNKILTRSSSCSAWQAALVDIVVFLCRWEDAPHQPFQHEQILHVGGSETAGCLLSLWQRHHQEDSMVGQCPSLKMLLTPHPGTSLSYLQNPSVSKIFCEPLNTF